MVCRPATPADVEQVLTMVGQIVRMHERLDRPRFAAGNDATESYRRWLAARSQDAESVFLVADRGGQCVAFLVATVEPSVPIYLTRSFGFIHDLWVEPDYRNEGIARQLVMLAIERFRQIGVNQIRLETAEANDVARTLFERCGFRVTTREMMLEMK
jgi:ribosomal protein S18 acetylase RimI-like enzyme